MKKYAGEKLIFTDGLELLNNPAYLAEDLVHPTLEGIGEIAERWSEVMSNRMQIHSQRR